MTNSLADEMRAAATMLNAVAEQVETAGGYEKVVYDMDSFPPMIAQLGTVLQALGRVKLAPR